jgi:transcriptional regulator with XRE-family HTH domain
LTQEELAGRVGVSQAWISQIELGHGRAVPLEFWVKLGVALDRPLAVALSRPHGESREPIDAGHLAMQERLLGLARATGRTGTFELPTRPADPRHSIDVCVRDVRNRVVLIEEAWNTFGDIGAASAPRIGSLRRRQMSPPRSTTAPPYRVAGVDRPAQRRESPPGGPLPADLPSRVRARRGLGSPR